MKHFFALLIIFFAVFLPVKTNCAEILQINNSNTILVGDQNRNLLLQLPCEISNAYDEIEAVNLLKKEFPRRSKVKIKPITFKENILIAEVFDLKETKEMSKLLVAKNLVNETCQN